MMHKKLLLVLLTVLFIPLSSLAEQIDSYQADIYRDGKKHRRLIYSLWSGEYPGPVILIGNSKQGNTTINAYKSLRKLDHKVKCTVPNGLYHPWSENKNAVINYYSLISINTAKVLKSTELENTKLKKGDEITNIYYLAENYCSGILKSKREKLEFQCTTLYDDKETYESKDDDFEYLEQWLYLKCNEGYHAFVQDKSLLAQPQVKEGKIIRYGKISQ